jgi:hypothetical protein
MPSRPEHALHFLQEAGARGIAVRALDVEHDIVHEPSVSIGRECAGRSRVRTRVQVGHDARYTRSCVHRTRSTLGRPRSPGSHVQPFQRARWRHRAPCVIRPDAGVHPRIEQDQSPGAVPRQRRAARVPAPTLLGWFAILSEFAGGLLLALGLFTRAAGLAVAGTLFIAAFKVHAADPFAKKELALAYAVVGLAFALSGGGRYALDA